MMKIMEKFKQKNESLYGAEPVTIATLGDSVTQGCFEVFWKAPGVMETVFEQENSYGAHLKRILGHIYPQVPVNLIPAGLSGDSAKGGLLRLERDVLRYCPDLTVVSFGLNECLSLGRDGVSRYGDVLRELFDRLQAAGSEVIFITQNYMNTKVSPHLTDPEMRAFAERTAKSQNDGTLKAYYEEAKRVCAEKGVVVCDLYSTWEAMEKSGADVTDLLSNYLNHPKREYHAYMAMKIVEKMLGVDP